jgi:hypothetical protein
VAPTIQDGVPVAFSAGVTVKFHRSFNDFPPADGWTYKIYFNGATDVFNAAAVVDPQDSSAWLVTINPTDSEVDPGLYRYVERVSSAAGDEVYDVGEGVVQIEPDLATAPAGATLSLSERTLAAIEAEIASRIAGDVEEYSVQASSLGGGRSVKKIPMVDLQKLRGHYGSMVWRQKNPGKIGAPVLVDFVDESNDANFPSTWVDVTGLPGAGQ